MASLSCVARGLVTRCILVAPGCLVMRMCRSDVRMPFCLSILDIKISSMKMVESNIEYASMPDAWCSGGSYIVLCLESAVLFWRARMSMFPVRARLAIVGLM